MANVKQIQDVQITRQIDGSDKLLVVKSGINKTRSVSVDDFIHENSINTGEINKNAIVEDKIADLAIASRHLQANSVTADKIAANAITSNDIASNAITADEIAANNITSDSIASNSITVDQIAANSITTDTLAANIITADQIAANVITADQIAANSITTDTLAANAITADTLAANAITADKISNGTIASESMIASNIITAQSISSNAIITGSIQSKNFDGSYNSGTGVIVLGTQGFYLEGNTGTIIANTLVARDDIITGNMIKFSDGKALTSNSDTGELEVVVDDDTLSIQDGKLAIKSVPSTANYTPTGDITYSGATTEKAIGTYSRGTGDVYSSVIGVGNTIAPFAGEYTVGDFIARRAAASMFTIDLLDHVSGPSAVTGIRLYNITFEVDYTNIQNLAAINGLCNIGFLATPSDSLTDFVNVQGSGQGTFFQISNPVFPVAKVDYTLANVNLISPANLFNTNRYIHVYPYFAIRNSVAGGPYQAFAESDTIGIKIKASTDMRLIINASGTLTNTNRSMQSLLDTTSANDYWPFSYNAY